MSRPNRVHPEGYVNKMNENVTPDADLLYEVRDGIGRIVFNRPQARNSLTFGMYERLAAICEAAADDRSLKVLALEPVGVLMDRSIGDERLIAQLCGFFGALLLPRIVFRRSPPGRHVVRHPP